MNFLTGIKWSITKQTHIHESKQTPTESLGTNRTCIHTTKYYLTLPWTITQAWYNYLLIFSRVVSATNNTYLHFMLLCSPFLRCLPRLLLPLHHDLTKAEVRVTNSSFLLEEKEQQVISKSNGELWITQEKDESGLASERTTSTKPQRPFEKYLILWLPR